MLAPEASCLDLISRGLATSTPRYATDSFGVAFVGDHSLIVCTSFVPHPVSESQWHPVMSMNHSNSGITRRLLCALIITHGGPCGGIASAQSPSFPLGVSLRPGRRHECVSASRAGQDADVIPVLAKTRKGRGGMIPEPLGIRSRVRVVLHPPPQAGGKARAWSAVAY